MILGTVQLGMDYGINNTVGMPSQGNSYEILDAARLGGVRALDTAGGYGSSEQIIGDYLTKHPRAFDICTKLSPDIDKVSTIKDAVRQDLGQRFDRLGADALFCCYLHQFHQCKNVFIMGQLISAKNEGIVKNIGVSIYYPMELDYITNNLRDAVDIVQVPLNVLSYPQWEAVMNEAVASGITLYARSVYLQGLLLMDSFNDKVMALDASSYIDAVHSRALEKGLPVAEYCFGFVAALPQISDVIIGCETKQQLVKNLSYSAFSPDVAEREILFSRAAFSKVPDGILDPSKWSV